MTTSSIKKLIDELGFAKFFSKHKKDFDISELWRFEYPYDKLSEVFYVVYHDITPPKCSSGQKKSFIDFSKGYRETSCIFSKDDKCICLTNFRKNKSTKIHQNMSIDKKNKAKEKAKKTTLERYGVENVFQSDTIKEKIKKTTLERYGVEHISKSKDIKKTKERTSIKRYGVSHPAKTNNFQDKRRKTLLEKYGVSETFFSNMIKEKAKKTNLERYGVENVFNSEIFQKKATDSILKKYGVKNIGSKNLSDETKNIINNKEEYVIFSKNKSFELVAKELNMSATRIAEISRKYDCLSTMNIGAGSSEQTILTNYIKSLNIKTQSNDRQLIKPLELDIFLPNYNIAIEYHGLYWHTELTGGKDKTYHKNKLLECNKKGIELIQIFSDEWISNSPIIKSIISTKLGLNQKIYARKTEIKEISEKESKLFLEENHLQGNVIGSTKRYGLFYNDGLVSVMTFQLKKGIWELKRYANKLNLNIIGGASKLFKHFIKENNPEEIFSYCDLRYFNGGVYKSLGFDFDKVTNPGYFYVKNNTRHHRLNFTKKKLIEQGHDPNKTEKEIMIDLGYDIIWDCGHSKWIWRKNIDEE